MSYTYVFIDGQRVEVNVAAAYTLMAADFKRDTGCDLHIRSGTRTNQEQIGIFLERYVTAGNVNGRKVYDTRWWNGQLWYRVSSAGTVAQPGTSNHEEDGPNGPRSIDIYDSGADAGVTRFGTARDRWMQDNAAKYGFENEGNKFDEAWHKTFRGTIGGTAANPQNVIEFSQDVANRQAWLNADRGEKLAVDGRLGPLTIAAIQRYQRFLGVAADGDWGPKTQAAHQKHYDSVQAAKAAAAARPSKAKNVLSWNWNGIAAMLRRYAGYVGNNTPGPVMVKALQHWLNTSGYARAALGQNLLVDGDFGDKTLKAVQQWLKSRWSYTGKIDADPGPGTQAAWNRAEKANWDASAAWRR